MKSLQKIILTSFICVFLLGCGEQGIVDLSPEEKKIKALKKDLLLRIDTIFSELSYNDLHDIDESLNIDNSPLTDLIYDRLVNPIDRCTGLTIQYKEIYDSIEELKKSRLYSDSNDNYSLQSEFSRFEESDFDINKYVRREYIKNLKKYHLKDYDIIFDSTKNPRLKDSDIVIRKTDTTRVLVDEFAGRWSTIQLIVHRDTVVPNRAGGPSSKFDLGAVCPPVCPVKE